MAIGLQRPLAYHGHWPTETIGLPWPLAYTDHWPTVAIGMLWLTVFKHLHLGNLLFIFLFSPVIEASAVELTLRFGENDHCIVLAC